MIRRVMGRVLGWVMGPAMDSLAFAALITALFMVIAVCLSPAQMQNTIPDQRQTASRVQSEDEEKIASIYAPLKKVPPKAVQRENPLVGDPDAVAAGEKLFSRHCAECHGEMAQGGRKAPSLLAGPVQQAAPGALFWILTNGIVRHGMPVWSKLPEPQRWQLVSYIKSLTSSVKPPKEQKPPGAAQAERNYRR